MTDKSVEIIPLGGLGEIGLNTMVLHSGDDMVVIDAGLMFPEEHMYGVDVVIPDFGFLVEHAEFVRAIVLTHGHEDHIGALPYLLSLIDVPVYGTRLTLELVRARLKEHDLLDVATLIEITPRQKLTIGPFDFEFIRVSHSIIDGVGLGITTPAGIIVHTGDFKIEQSPAKGQEIDLSKFAEYGEKGVLALLSDSTNVERPGYTMSEKNIGRAFREIFRDRQGRIIVSMFSSSIARIQQVVSLAEEFGRRVAFSGRSMVTNVAIAKSLGYLEMNDEQEISVKRIKSIPDDKVLLITTGSQGEPMSALTRMASGTHKQIQIKTGDTVILSSRMIPGNERAITTIINNLYRQGAEVIYETVSEIHVSGHAYQEELKLMINLVRPEYFIPIHGEYRHLTKHIDLAHQVGLDREKLILAQNGDIIRFENKAGSIVGKAETGHVLVDGKGVGDIGKDVLRDRKHLAEHGMVIPLIIIAEDSGEIISGPDIVSKGFIFEETDELLSEAKKIIQEIFAQFQESRSKELDLTIDTGEIKADIHRELRRFFNKAIDRRPVILPQIILI